MSEVRALLSRRHFLFALGAGGAATAATAVARSNAKEQAPNPVTGNGHAARGYQETAHVASYYRSTRI
jgi:hypothetical protein